MADDNLRDIQLAELDMLRKIIKIIRYRDFCHLMPNQQ